MPKRQIAPLIDGGGATASGDDGYEWLVVTASWLFKSVSLVSTKWFSVLRKSLSAQI